jgi:hypothetical protein
MHDEFLYVQVRFGGSDRRAWVTLACESTPDAARKRAAVLYAGALTASGEYPVGVRIVGAPMVDPEELDALHCSRELALEMAV